MKKALITLLLALISSSCQQVLIREYESPLSPQFFRQADCKKNEAGHYVYSKGSTEFILTQSILKKLNSNKLEWSKSRNEILYPHQYLDIAVPYMLRDGMPKDDILTLLGKVDRSGNRFMYYKLSNGSELILFKGTLSMPKGMKSITIQGLQYKDDFKLPALKK